MAFRFVTIPVICISLLTSYAQDTRAQDKKKDAKPDKSDKWVSAQVPAEPATTQATFGDWTLTCQRTEVKSMPKLCEVAHSVVARGQQQGPIMQIALSPLKGTERSVTVVLPNNVTLAEGPKFGLGDNDPKPVALTYVRCLPIGCVATANVDAETVTAWRNATQQGVTTFVDGAQRTLNIPVSLRGLSQALDALAKE